MAQLAVPIPDSLRLPDVDLDARAVYFPVRHHSPACAWHVERLIRELRPKAVLLEGPRDATPLIPFLLHEVTRMPVAIYTTFVERPDGEPPARHAAYYPLCDYSPELAAIRAANGAGASVKFIDLTFPEMVRAESRQADPKARSLLEEHYFRHSRFLRAACQRSGARDPDDLWDHLYEVNYREMEAPAFIRNVLAYCALARQDYTAEMLAAEGCDAREKAMAAAITAEKGRVVVVTGGFHSVALPKTEPEMPQAIKVCPEDAQVVLMRYSFEQLDSLNGYASGMPSPGFYQRQWEGGDASEIIVELARRSREKQPGASVADEIAALHHARRLASFRGHPTPSREDVLDGIRSTFVKGAEEVEGVLVMAMARKLLAGERIGNVPPEAGAPPILEDFRQTADRLRLDLQGADAGEVVLDLYRKSPHRDASRFFCRLCFLEVPFAEWQRGPDFVSGEGLERVQEAWKYRWSPATESTLIERSLYGATLEEAATALVLERFEAAEKQGQGRRADLAARLLLEACRMGLHRRTQELLDRTGRLVAEDASFLSLVTAMESLLVLRVSREPLEAHHIEGLSDVAAASYDRACYLLPGLSNTPEPEEESVLDALNTLVQAVGSLGDSPARRQLRRDRLRELADSPAGRAALRGGAAGLLYGDGQLDAPSLVSRLQGHLLSTRLKGDDGPNFLRGLLRTARSVLWQVPELVASLHAALRGLEEARFVRQLPLLRLAFADLTPRECDRVARAVAALSGTERLDLPLLLDFSSRDALMAAEVNLRLAESLQADGLGDWLQGST